MAIDKRHLKDDTVTDMDLTQKELEALQDKYGTGKAGN